MLPSIFVKRKSPFRELQNEIDNLFKNFFPAIEKNMDLSDYFESFNMNVYEKNNSLFVEAELPGFEKKDINISLENGILTISGEKKRTEKEEDKNYYCQEVLYGKFSRKIDVGQKINEDKIKASFKNGILHLELPYKKEITNRKQIAIED
jgi:HSP20 family protein